MEFANVLSRTEMKNIKGGTCGILYDGEWICGFAVWEAQGWYNNGATGYCCSSCGQEGFLSSPC